MDPPVSVLEPYPTIDNKTVTFLAPPPHGAAGPTSLSQPNRPGRARPSAQDSPAESPGSPSGLPLNKDEFPDILMVNAREGDLLFLVWSILLA